MCSVCKRRRRRRMRLRHRHCQFVSCDRTKYKAPARFAPCVWNHGELFLLPRPLLRSAHISMAIHHSQPEMPPGTAVNADRDLG